MEHRLILGGAQYLPFARSLIRALRATGLQHAAQRRVFTDAELTVRIEGEQDFIYIVDTKCRFEMDSGAVELTSLNPIIAGNWLAGTLHETTTVAAYNTPFTQVDTTGQWRTTVDTKPNVAGQLSGFVSSTAPKFLGRVPVDLQPARSFSPLKTADVNGNVTSSTTDDTLTGKKDTCANVPPSCFTGRTRLWVQAMYGQPLYSYSNEDKGLGGKPTPKRPNRYAGFTPILIVPCANKRKDTSEYPPVLVDTSAGVHKDTTGRHWLFVLTTDTLYVYPMLSSPCGENARRFIADTSTKLNATDREHLETYILATSRPVAEKMQTISLGGTFTMSSMGYGWHWNYSGTCADIVENLEYDQGGGNFGMVSTHRRITMSSVVVDGLRTWSAAISVVEDAKFWSLNRTNHCIAGPEWALQESFKLTPRYSTQIECDAPFYCFYTADLLQVCRVKAVYVGAAPRVEQTPGYDVGAELTCGDRNGYLDVLTESAYWSFIFTCGSVVYDKLYTSRHATGYRHQTSNGTPSTTYDTTLEALNANILVEWGYPDTGYQSQLFLGRDSDVMGILASNAHPIQMSLDYETSTVVDDYYSQAILAAPFNDAQAIYVQADCSRERQKSAITVKHNQSLSHISPLTRLYFPGPDPVLHPYDGAHWSDPYTRFVWGPASGDSNVSTETPADPPIETLTVTDLKKLQCVRGVIGAAIPTLSEYHDGSLDYASPGFFAKTSAASNGQVVIAQYVTTLGLNVDLTIPALVGFT